MEKRKTVKIKDATNSNVEKLYSSFGGRVALKVLIRPKLSKFVGFILDKRISKVFISSFIKNNNIDMTKYLNRDYSSFNDFFTREKIECEKKIDYSDGAFISPCDAGLSAYNIQENSSFKIKGVNYSVASLLENEDLANEYIGGLCLVFRLSVDDYHRYCYIDNGTKSENVHIDGVLHTVQPIAVINELAFVKNTREYTCLYTENFDKVIQIEIGALLVGKIKNYHGEVHFLKGEEKGMFEYGGSTIVLLLKKDVLELDCEFFENTCNDLETKVKYGETIGFRIKK